MFRMLTLAITSSAMFPFRYVCSAEEAEANRARFAKRNGEWWSHSACADSVWMEHLPELLRSAEDELPEEYVL